MEFKEFKGRHLLSGVDCTSHQEREAESGWEDYGDDYLICIDGINYLMIEDLNDGYRSNMLDPEITDREIKNKFEEQEVFIKHRTDGHYSGEEADVMEIYSMSGDLILEIGTENIDDYYPSAIFNYSPENMEINEGR